MDAGEARLHSIAGAAALFDHAAACGKPDAIKIATGRIVSAAVFLEEAVGTERALAILNAAAAVLNNKTIKN
jgi:hypothetical protein